MQQPSLLDKITVYSRFFFPTPALKSKFKMLLIYVIETRNACVVR